MKKENTNVAKVNKEIGGWDYKGFHIDRNKELKALTVVIAGDEVVVKTLGEAKQAIDEQIEYSEAETKKAIDALNLMADTIAEVVEPKDEEIINFTSKRGTKYLLQVVDDKIKAFTYEAGKKHYWTVTSEIRAYVAGLV